MDSRIQVWNDLHDGEITAVSEDAGRLTMFVSIPFLRRRLKPLGDSFVLTLEAAKRVEFRNFDGTATSLREELDNSCTPAILSTKSAAMPVTIETTTGQLILDFEHIRFAMDTGQEIAYETIETVCREYWTEWQKKAEQSAGGNAASRRASA